MTKNKRNNGITHNGHLYSIKDNEWLEKQRKAGRLLANAIRECISRVRPGSSTQDIDDWFEEYIKSFPGYSSTFKGYRGFPASTCVSVNTELVHGIPKKDKIIQDGDMLKIDAGITFEGAIADMARTVIVGESKNIKNTILIET
jgi:methionyl aminopeptidase